MGNETGPIIVLAVMILVLSSLTAPASVSVWATNEAIVTASPSSIINNATIGVFQPRFLSGTWNFVNDKGNVSGIITFSNQDLCVQIYGSNCKWDWQHQAAFSGIFSGHPVSGKYDWQYAPGPPGFINDSYLNLLYNYNHINLLVMGNLTVINPAHMEWTQIGPINYDRHDYVVDGNYRLATGLHLHHGDTIHLMRIDATQFKNLPDNATIANSTDGGKCVKFTCQIQLESPMIKQVSIFCQPIQTAPIFPWREWYIW